LTYPPDVTTPEHRRRWELVVAAVLISYGFDPSDSNEVLDPILRIGMLHGIESLYRDTSLETGEGEITDEQRHAMRQMGVL
jgi:hypothetical protein